MVDDEPVTCVLLSELLGPEGFDVDTASDAESAWDLIQTRKYDLLVAARSLPRRSGVDLIAQIASRGIDLPTVILTSNASPSALDHLMRQGAADYIAKPFPDIRHVVRRLVAVVERRATNRVHERMIGELGAALADSRDDVVGTQQEITRFEASLRRRAAVMVADPGFDAAYGIADSLARRGLGVQVERGFVGARNRLNTVDAPLVVIVGLDHAGALDFIADAKLQDPLLELLATSGLPHNRVSLQALEAGATDFVSASLEGPTGVERRALRLVELARRNRISANVIALLHRRAHERRLPTARLVWEALSERQRRSLGIAAPFDHHEEPEVIVELEHERRRDPRQAATLLLTYVGAGGADEPRVARTRDVSAGGLFIVTPEPLAVGRQLRLALRDPDERRVEPVALTAEVVRWTPTPEEGGGAGLRLSSRHLDYVSLVARLLERRRY